METTKWYFLFSLFLGMAFASNKYYISSTSATFLQALSYCRRFGMQLVTIESEMKNSDLYSNFVRLGEKNDWYWTTGIYQNNSMTREWYWLATDKEVVYTDWRQNDVPLEPRYYPNTDNCLRWGFYDAPNAPKGLWRVDDCNSKLRFICERPYCGNCGNKCCKCNDCNNCGNTC